MSIVYWNNRIEQVCLFGDWRMNGEVNGKFSGWARVRSLKMIHGRSSRHG